MTSVPFSLVAPCVEMSERCLGQPLRWRDALRTAGSTIGVDQIGFAAMSKPEVASCNVGPRGHEMVRMRRRSGEQKYRRVCKCRGASPAPLSRAAGRPQIIHQREDVIW